MKHAVLLCAMAAIGLAACTQDEQTGTLPEGKYPLVINAIGLQTATLDTRATVDGDWENVTEVGVQVGDKVKGYFVDATADPTKATLSNDDNPFYWNASTMTVSAWWPYNKNKPSMTSARVHSNQSVWEAFANSDCLLAKDQTVSIDNPTLVFSHGTARVKVILEVGSDITSLEGATVSLIGLTTEYDNPATIIPYNSADNTFEALLRPQTISAHEPFIQVVLNGETYSYGLEDGITLEANHRYTYNVTVSELENMILTSCTISAWDEVEAVETVSADYADDGQGTYTVYTGKGLKAVADLISEGDYDINVKLDRDIDLTGVDWKRIEGSYQGTFDGQGHRITGLSINAEDGEYAILFYDIGENGTVKNLQLEGVNYTSGNYGAYGITLGNSGTITACSVTGTLTASEDVAGITSSSRGTITACWFNGTLSAPRSCGIATYCVQQTAIPNGGVISACYWGGNAEVGVDYQTSGATTEATKVNDDESWQSAIDGMNAALTDNDYEWALGTDGLPVLKKKA